MALSSDCPNHGVPSSRFFKAVIKHKYSTPMPELFSSLYNTVFSYRHPVRAVYPKTEKFDGCDLKYMESVSVCGEFVLSES